MIEGPRASVIIASYRWPEALRISLAGALAQTVRDIEVLVVEDGEDTASREVVRQAGDSRVRWLACLPSAGSQSGPNTVGLAHAAAPAVAYLGHDDLWHPEHLATTLASLTPDVDIAHAVTMLLGDEGRRELAGGRPWEPATFVPPSSIVHRRISPRIGAWPAAGSTGLPVDQAFLLAAHERGARVATTGEPTVFKFPAAWRLDSYRTRDVAPQRRLQAALRHDPGLGPRLVREAVAGDVPVILAAPQPGAPGAIADFNRRMKGLERRFGPSITSWVPDRDRRFPGWHGREEDAGGAFAWTGPGERATVRFDSPGEGRLGVAIIVRHVLAPRHLDLLDVELDGDPVTLHRRAGPFGASVLTGWLARAAAGATVDVVLRGPVRPAPGGDARLLGVAVGRIELLQR